MEPGQDAPRKRTLWIWLIAIFYGVSVPWTVLSFWRTNSGAIPLTGAQAAYFASLSAFDYFVSIATGVCTLCGAVALFFLRKSSVPLLLVGLGLNAAVLVWHSLTKQWVAAMSGPGMVGAVIGWTLTIAVVVYAWRLMKRGALA